MLPLWNMGFVIVSWLSALLCVGIGFRAFSRLVDLEPTSEERAAHGTTAEQVAALNERLTDVGYELAHVQRLLPALRRIALLTGTALAVTQFATRDGFGSKVPLSFATFAAGLVAFALLTQIGRKAKRQAETLRSNWNLLSRRLIRRTADPS